MPRSNAVNLTPLETAMLDHEVVKLVVETNQSHIRIGEAARTRLFRNGERLSIEPDARRTAGIHRPAVHRGCGRGRGDDHREGRVRVYV